MIVRLCKLTANGLQIGLVFRRVENEKIIIMRKWTDEEDKLIIEYAEKNKNHIRNGFKELSLIIDRSSEAIVSRFYNKLNKIKPKN